MTGLEQERKQLEQWKKQLLIYFNGKYFMSNPDNWEELANAAVERAFWAEVLRRNKLKSNAYSLPEITVTAPNLAESESPKLAFETDWDPAEIKEMETPQPKIIHFDRKLAREAERDALKGANLVAGIMAPAFIPALAPFAAMTGEAGLGAGLWQGAKYLGNQALRLGYKYVPKIGKALDMTFPGSKTWWLLYNSGKTGKLLASGFAGAEALGTSTAVNNFIENPSAENATSAGLFMIPWAAGTTNGIRSYNTARNYSKVTKALKTKHDIDTKASYAPDVLRKYNVGSRDYIHIGGGSYDPKTGEYRRAASYEKDGQLMPLGGYGVDRQGNKQTAIWFRQGSPEYNVRSGDVYVLPYYNSADIPLHLEDGSSVYVSRDPINLQKLRKFKWDYDKHDLVEIPTGDFKSGGKINYLNYFK